MHRGYLKLWRKTEDSGLLQMPETLALFAFLLIKATHKPIKIGTPYGLVSLEAGQYISGRLELASALKMSERGVRTSLDRLVKMEILTIKPTNRYSVYTIVKYSEYQECGQQPTSQTPTGDQQVTSSRPASDQQPTTKQTHKHKNTKELKEEATPFVLPDWIDKTQWELWLKTRKGKKMTPDQMQSNVAKLQRWRDAGLDHCGALADAAAGGWQGLHEPKNAGQRRLPVQENFADKDYGKGVTLL